jgi:hypothetical protein
LSRLRLYEWQHDGQVDGQGVKLLPLVLANARRRKRACLAHGFRANRVGASDEVSLRISAAPGEQRGERH